MPHRCTSPTFRRLAWTYPAIHTCPGGTRGQRQLLSNGTPDVFSEYETCASGKICAFINFGASTASAWKVSGAARLGVRFRVRPTGSPPKVEPDAPTSGRNVPGFGKGSPRAHQHRDKKFSLASAHSQLDPPSIVENGRIPKIVCVCVLSVFCV